MTNYIKCTALEMVEYLGNEGLLAPLKALEETGKFVFFHWKNEDNDWLLACICRKADFCPMSKGRIVSWIYLDRSWRLSLEKSKRAKASVEFHLDDLITKDEEIASTLIETLENVQARVVL